MINAPEGYALGFSYVFIMEAGQLIWTYSRFDVSLCYGRKQFLVCLCVRNAALCGVKHLQTMEQNEASGDVRSLNLRQFAKRKTSYANLQNWKRRCVVGCCVTVSSNQCGANVPVERRDDRFVHSANANCCSGPNENAEGRDSAGHANVFNEAHGGGANSMSGQNAHVDNRECFNCHRRFIPLFAVRRCDIKSRRPMKLFKMRSIRRNAVATFCEECRTYLTVPRVKPDDWRLIWPAFMWQFLTDTSSASLSHVQGSSYAWQFVPVTWRRWWLFSLRSLSPLMWHVPAITIDLPLPHFKDVTDDLRRFATMMDNLELGEIRRVCNDINFPTVLCPWGCSTFLQDVGVLSLPAVFHHVLRKQGARVKMTAVSRRVLLSCLSMRPDYLDPSHPKHICAEQFTVYPSVAFHPEKGMSVLTCKHHCGGTTKRYLHVPKSELGLPSDLGDQLAHCVVHHRTIKPTIAKKYSNSYQLSHQRGCFAGIDLSALKASGNFGARSAILHSSEALSIACRDDIRGLLSQLQEDGCIPESTAAGFRDCSARVHPDGGSAFRRRYAAGSTFITSLDCMKLQRELATVHEISIRKRKNGKWEYITFTPSWVRSLVFIHPYDGHGSLFHALPVFKGRWKSARHDLRLVFVVLSMVTSIPLLWEHLESRIVSDTDWMGFLLAYASKEIVYYRNHCRRSQDDPFVIDKRFTPTKLYNMLNVSGSFDSMQVFDLFESCCSSEKFLFWGYAPHFAPRDPSIPFDPSGLCRTHDVFMCARSREYMNRQGSCLPHTFVSDGTKFELRFVLHENVLGKCTVVVRHGGQFARWYVTDQNADEYYYMEDDDELLTSGSWVLGVYLNTTPSDTDQLRRDFLSYTGGQITAICGEHDYPLIVVGPPDDRFRCPGLPGQASCGGKVYYNCPKRGCRKCLCKKCLGSISHDTTLRLHRDSLLRSQPVVTLDEVGDDDVSTDTSEDESEYVDRSDNDKDRHSVSSIDSDVFFDGDEASVNSDDQRLGVPHTHDLHDGTDEPIFDIELEDDSESFSSPTFPKTISHCNTIPEIVADETSDMVGNIILLNGLGSLLVRRRHNLTFSRKNTEFLQRKIISRYGKSIPLIYAEATLYPSIFPYDSGTDGSILGAIPSAFLSQEKNSVSHGVASLADHAMNRLFLAGNTAASDYRYQAFLFDALVNSNCSSEDSRVVLNRGVAESNTPTGLRTRSKDDHFFSDSIDNRQMVLNLTESQKYHPSNLFITITANQKLTFGLSPIKEFLDSHRGLDAIEDTIGRKLQPWERDEYDRALHDASCTLMTRCWLKVRYIIMTYIMQSFEEPLRKVITLFWRDEYQGNMGNLSHIHGLLKVCVDMLDPEDLKKFHDVIRGFSADIVRIEEIDDYVARGLFDSGDDWFEVVEQAKTVLTHKTRRNLRRTGTGDNDLVRRDVDYVHITPDHTRHCTVRVDPGHKPDVIAELVRCQLVRQPPPENPWLFDDEHEILRCVRHIPPLRAGENNMSPVNGTIFVGTRSMQNVQQTSGYSVNRYVTKYLVKIDQNSHSYCKVNPKNEREVKVKTTFLHNTKISSSAYNENKRISEQREKNHPSGRAIARTEIVQLLSREPQVYTNMIFDRVDTTPLEDRVGLHKVADRERRSRNDDDNDDDFLYRYQRMSGNNSIDFLVMSDFVRYEFGFPTWRLFTPNQIVIINDNSHSKVTVSKATVFSVRPPELRELFPTMTHYFRWFKRSRVCGGNKHDAMTLRLSIRLHKCEWVDGFGYNVQLRSAALGEVKDYLRERVPSFRRQPDQSILDLLQLILRFSERPDQASPIWCAIRKLFLYNPTGRNTSTNHHPAESPLPIPVHSCIRPSNAIKFLYHILLSMGCFPTEIDLLGFPTLRESFVYAGLVDDSSETAVRLSVTALIRRYVIEQLAYYPISSRTWGNYLLLAAKALRDAIIDGSIPINDMPACLYTKLHADVLEKTKARIDVLRESVVTASYNELRSSLESRSDPPSLQGLLDGSQVFDGVLGRPDIQTWESFEEQQKIRAMIRRTYDDYTDPSRTTLSRSLMIAGGPGNGKTHCLMYGVLYFVSNGLLTVSTSVLAERSIELGGEHLHKLFHLPVASATAQRLAELSVINILRRPSTLELLLAIDAIALDECGTISSTLLSALDIILRRLRGVSTYMGGVCIITTIDDKQLRPIDGYPVLLSPNVLTCFNVAMLEQSVRSVDDLLQQRVIQISRYSDSRIQMEPHLIDEVVQIISEECTFVRSFDDEQITRSTLRIFGRKDPVRVAVEKFYATIEEEYGRLVGANLLRSRVSDDLQIAVESHGSHVPATTQVRKLLDKHTREPRRLLFFKHAVYQFTFNDPGNDFSQSRLAILVDLPSQNQLDNWESFPIFAAPAGVKCAPKHLTITTNTIWDITSQCTDFERSTLLSISPSPSLLATCSCVCASSSS